MPSPSRFSFSSSGRPSRGAFLLSTLLLSLVLPLGGGSALEGSLRGLPAAAPGQESLDETARRFVSAWGAGDVNGLVRLLSAEGIRLHLGEGGHVAVGVRQAGAALRELHQGVRPGGARLVRASGAEGNPPRGFAELQWTPAGEGGARRVYVAFVEEGGSWRVSEIRLLR